MIARTATEEARGALRRGIALLLASSAACGDGGGGYSAALRLCLRVACRREADSAEDRSAPSVGLPCSSCGSHDGLLLTLSLRPPAGTPTGATSAAETGARKAVSKSIGSAVSGSAVGAGAGVRCLSDHRRGAFGGVPSSLSPPPSSAARVARFDAVMAAAVAERSAAENEVEIDAFFLSRLASSRCRSMIFSTSSTMACSEPAQHLNS